MMAKRWSMTNAFSFVIYVKDRLEEEAEDDLSDEDVIVESYPPPSQVSPLNLKTFIYLMDNDFGYSTRLS